MFSVVLTGEAGGPGINRYCVQAGAPGSWTNTNLNAVAAAIAAIYSAHSTSLPTGCVYSVQNTMQEVDEASGQIIAVHNIPTVSVVTGTGAGTWVAGTGVRMYWHTNTVINRRMVRGATFITPLPTSFMTGTGTLSVPSQTSFAGTGQTYIAAIVAAACLPVVWHRPAKLTHTGGLAAAIINCSVGPQVGSLRSRRQ
jgi:hypothetical protein